MNRRIFLKASAGVMTMLAAGVMTPVLASDDEVVKSKSIVDALSKDIVLDRPGAGRPQQGATRPASRPASINLNVQFTFDSAELLPQGKRQLDELAMALSHKTLSTWGFVLAGHTDRVGAEDYNLRLSLARAETVRSYLAEVHRLAPSRLKAIGYGFNQLLDPANPTAAINRRVEVRRVAVSALGRESVSSGTQRVPSGPSATGQLIPTPR